MGLSYLQGPHHSGLARPTGSFSNQPLETETGLVSLRDVLTWSRGMESQKVTTVAKRKNKLHRGSLSGSRGGKERLRSERDTQASKVLINLFLRLSSRSKGLPFIVHLRCTIVIYVYTRMCTCTHVTLSPVGLSINTKSWQHLGGMGLSCN